MRVFTFVSFEMLGGKLQRSESREKIVTTITGTTRAHTCRSLRAVQDESLGISCKESAAEQKSAKFSRARSYLQGKRAKKARTVRLNVFQIKPMISDALHDDGHLLALQRVSLSGRRLATRRLRSYGTGFWKLFGSGCSIARWVAPLSLHGRTGIVLHELLRFFNTDLRSFALQCGRTRLTPLQPLGIALYPG